MGEKIWLSTRNFGSKVTVRPPTRSPVSPHHTFLHCVGPATCVQLGHPNNNKLKPFSRLNFCVYADMNKRERARARDKKKKKQSGDELHKT